MRGSSDTMRDPSNNAGALKPVPVVGVVVLHWGSPRTTEACLRSLQRSMYPAVRVFLIDNARSLDPTTAELAAPLAIDILRPPRNLGFAEGCGWGIAAALEAKVDYIFLLNNDAVVSRHCLETLVAVARLNPPAGILSPQIACQESPDQVWYRGGEFSLWGLGPRHTGARRRVETELPPTDVDYATGCAMLINP